MSMIVADDSARKGWYAYGIRNGMSHEQATRFAEMKIRKKKGVQTLQDVI